jgi:DNA modification methylase
MKSPPYLLLKATGFQIPLLDGSVGLVIATPPYFGEKRARRGEFCTSDRGEYRRLMTQFLGEATRIVKPYGHILLYASGHEAGKVFEVFQKRIRGGRWTWVRVRSHSFTAHYVDVKGFSWEALPVRLYRELIHRYSAPGEAIAHVFSGSGNSGIAAVELRRKPVLVDLHHHRQVRRRLKKRMRSKPEKAAGLQKTPGKSK